MELKPTITLTGADERTDLTQLALLPAETGLLYTLLPEGRNRYPQRAWLHEAVRNLPRPALHICGYGGMRYALAGNLADLIEPCPRIQLNGGWLAGDVEKLCARYPDKTFITQHNQWGSHLRSVTAPNHAILVDASGGRGLRPEAWIQPDTTKRVGFAGGLGPGNLAMELPLIAAVAKAGWWVDMENQLREDDWFHLGRAAEACAIFHDYLHHA